MNVLPGPLGSRKILAWRLDQERYRTSWDSGEGAFRFGGRWNSPGVRAVYCSIGPSTAILEVAVHRTFRALDTEPHFLTALEILDPSKIHVVESETIPNPNWLRPSIPSAGQQSFGDDLLSVYPFVLIPSVASTFAWNLMFDVSMAKDQYRLLFQKRFALDTRLHPGVTTR